MISQNAIVAARAHSPIERQAFSGAFTEIAQAATRQDYMHKAEHMRERVALLELAITETSNRLRPRYNRSSTIYRYCAVSQTSQLLAVLFRKLEALEPNGRRLVMKTRIITTAFARSLFGITRSVS